MEQLESRTDLKDYTLKNTKDFVLSYQQNEIVEFLLNNDYGYNAAQTGLGKTFTTITAAVHRIVERPNEDIHFICLLPGPAVKAFRDTLGTLLNIPYSIYTASSIKRQTGARFHIFNYSSLPKDVIKKNRKGEVIEVGTNRLFEYFKDLKQKHPNLWLIADESHVLQDPNTMQYSFVEAIKGAFIGMWFLTATPILNDLDGFYHMTNLTHPNFWGNIWQFRNTYQVFEDTGFWKYNPRKKAREFVKKKELSGYKNLDILKEKFKDISIIRAKQYDLNFIYKSVALNEATEAHYRLASEGLFSGNHKNTDNTKEVTHGARLHDLQRVVSNSHKDFNMYEGNTITEKEGLLFKTIMEVIEKEEATLIYFTYRETLARVKELLRSVQTELNIPTIHEIHGDISIKKRQLVEKNIKPRDVVLLTSAGTESVNLQKANNLIFYETPFALREFIQACGRITRTDTEFNTFDVYILEAENTIDTYKKNRIIANSSVIQSVVGGSNALPTEMLEITLEDIKVMKDELLWRK